MKTATSLLIPGLFLLFAGIFSAPSFAANPCSELFDVPTVDLFANEFDPGSRMRRALELQSQVNLEDLGPRHPARQLSNQLQKVKAEDGPVKIEVVSRGDFSFKGTAEIKRVGYDKAGKPVQSLIIEIAELSLKDWAPPKATKDTTVWEHLYRATIGKFWIFKNGPHDGKFEGTEEVAQQFAAMMAGMMQGIGELYRSHPHLTRLDVRANSFLPYTAISKMLAEFDFSRRNFIMRHPKTYLAITTLEGYLFFFPHISNLITVPVSFLTQVPMILLGGRTWQLTLDFNPQWKAKDGENLSAEEAAAEVAEGVRNTQ